MSGLKLIPLQILNLYNGSGRQKLLAGHPPS